MIKKEERNGKIITVASSKGGTGKTFMAINLAGIYSSMGYKTLIIDTDLGSGGISLSLNVGVNKDIYILSEDMKNNHFSKIDDYVYKYNENLKILSSPIDPRKISKFYGQYLELILLKAKEEFDVIILDTNHILDDLNLIALEKSDENLFVISSDVVGSKNLKSLISIFKDLKYDNYKIVLNDSLYKGKYKLSIADINSIIETKINYNLGNSLFISNYDNYLIKGDIPVLHKKNKVMYKKLKNIALDLIKQYEKGN